MKLIFASVKLWNAFSTLTSVSRSYVPPRTVRDVRGLLDRVEAAVGLPQLADAAVGFTIQLALDEGKLDDGKAAVLARALTDKLSTWRGEDGALRLVLWTHDMSCVIDGLSRAAQRYALPPQAAAGTLKSFVEGLLRDLAVAAVAFTMQLEIEDALRNLERELIALLEDPWELGTIPLAVDVGHGPSWGSLSDEK